jgi:hypothetical protein
VAQFTLGADSNWYTIYTRMNRWSKAGVFDRVFEQLQRSQLVRIRIEAVSLATSGGSTCTASERRAPRRPRVHSIRRCT